MLNASPIEQKQQLLKTLHHRYSAFSEHVGQEYIDRLQQLLNTFAADAENARNENRLLRIGIVGQIKRGKSSFLNSLLFEGKDVLPKAATPMTAALTKIRYAEKPLARIEFYNEADWQTVVQTAQSARQQQAAYQQALNAFQQQANKRGERPPVMPQIGEDAKACMELLGMVEKHGLDVSSYLGKVQELESAGSNEELVGLLNAYVGAQGRFTPIVKSTELCLNLPSLHDVEVVDTPGMNDPITSRSRRTQDFLGQCDVVFLLSYCGQFMDVHDMQLLAQSIPSKGIEDIVLVGSLFDSVLTDEYHNYAHIGEALPAITRKLNEQAQSNVDRVCRQEQQQEKSSQGHLMTALKNALPPIFISSRCLDIALHWDNLNEEEQHSLNQLNQMYSGFEFSPALLTQMANFAPVQKKLEQVKAKKSAILASRFDRLMAGLSQALRQLLQDIGDDIASKKHLLQEKDSETLMQEQQALLKKLESGETLIKVVFDKYAIRGEKALAEFVLDVSEASSKAKRIASHTGSRDESYTSSRQVYSPELFSPSTWFSKKTVYTTHYRTVNYMYANVNEAVNALEDFASEANRRLVNVTSSAIDLAQFREDIKAAMKGLLDFSSRDFDPEMILAPLSNALERITMPSIQLDLDKHIQAIRSRFSAGRVEGNEVEQLRSEQSRVVQLLIQDIEVEVDGCKRQLQNKLEQEQKDFLPKLTSDLRQRTAELEKAFANLEQTLAQYQEIERQIQQDLVALN